MTQDKARKIANEYMASAFRQIPLAQDIRAYGNQRREKALREAAEALGNIACDSPQMIDDFERAEHTVLALIDQPQDSANPHPEPDG